MISKPDPKFKDALFMVKYNEKRLWRWFFKTGVWQVWNLSSGASLPGTGGGFPQEQRGRHRALRQGPAGPLPAPGSARCCCKGGKSIFNSCSALNPAFL